MGFGSGSLDTGVASFGSSCFVLEPNGFAGSSSSAIKR